MSIFLRLFAVNLHLLALKFGLRRQHVFVGDHLELLETLGYPLVHLQELLHAVQTAAVFGIFYCASCEVKNAVGEACFG